MSIVAELPGFIQVFSDGTVKRFPPEVAPPSLDSYNGYKCKDVTIDSKKPITARMFLPNIINHTPLPVLVYFHGGGFCIGSTTWLGYHHFLGDLSVTAECVVLSIDYRLAPENKLPIAYEDCYSSLVWLGEVKRSKDEPWLESADLSSVFLSGDSAGGNIVHQVVIRAIRDESCPVRIRGVLPIHPYFGSKKRTELEAENESGKDVVSNDLFWGLSLPEGSDRDYCGCNYEKMELGMEEWSRFPVVVVFVAELDFLKERGVMYALFLERKGVKVKLVEAKGESHVYHAYRPDSEGARLLQRQMTEFIHSL